MKKAFLILVLSLVPLFCFAKSVSSPNEDKISFWDYSEGGIGWLEIGDNLSISGTTLNATGGSGTGESLPSMTGNSGKVLSNDGTTAAWYDIFSLLDPDVSANEYSYLNGLVNGSYFTYFGSVSDNTLYDLLAAIDTAIGVNYTTKQDADEAATDDELSDALAYKEDQITASTDKDVGDWTFTSVTVPCTDGHCGWYFSDCNSYGSFTPPAGTSGVTCIEDAGGNPQVYKFENGGTPVLVDAGSAAITNDSFDDWNGNTTEAPSAEALHTELQAIKQMLENITSNVFYFTFDAPATTPYYISATTIDFDLTITDTNATYAPTTLKYRVDGGSLTACTDVSNCDSIGLAADTSYTIDFQICDNNPTPVCQYSEERTVIRDMTDPVIVADSDSTHNSVTNVVAGCTLTETNPDSPAVTATVTGATPTNPTVTCTGSDCATEELTPTGTGTITVTFASTDLASNTATGTDLTQQFIYSGVCSTPATGDELSEGFLGTGYEDALNWSEDVGTNGTVNEDYTLTGSPPADSCSEGLLTDVTVGSGADDSFAYWNRGSTIAGTTTVDIYFSFKINSYTMPNNYDSIIILWWKPSSGTDVQLQASINGSGQLSIKAYGANSTSTHVISTATWYTGQLHLDATAANSYMLINELTECDEASECSFTRGAVASQYLRVGAAGGTDNDEAINIEWGGVWINTP